MGKRILTEAIQAIEAAGIPAQHGYPSGKAVYITGPVAAVNLQSADMRYKTVTVLASVMSPAQQGALACEEASLIVGEALNNAGGKCSVGKCRFDGEWGTFVTELTAQFATQAPKLSLDFEPMQHIEAFTAWRTLDESVTDWNSTKWNFRLEEYFPLGTQENDEPLGAFTLTYTTENGTETYTGCTWTYQRRVWDASGIRQIRLGVADGMEIG